MRPFWLPKPVYESLPYYYIVAGLICLGAALFPDFWPWTYVAVVAGFGCLVAGLVVWLKRRGFRQSSQQPEAGRVSGPAQVSRADSDLG